MPDLRIDTRDGVAWVIIDRPPVNALTIHSYREITETFAALSHNVDVRCIVFTGTGTRAFCAGFDFRQFASIGSQEDDPKRPEVMHRMFSTIRNCPIPVIGAINGAAIGAGCVLAAVCDIRIAAENARFGLPEIDFGRIGGAAYLGRLVSPGTLRHMAFTGKPIEAAEALRLGMVERVVPSGALAGAVSELAALITTKSDAGLRGMKSALNRIEDLPVDEGYHVEQERSAELRALIEDGRT